MLQAVPPYTHTLTHTHTHTHTYIYIFTMYVVKILRKCSEVYLYLEPCQTPTVESFCKNR